MFQVKSRTFFFVFSLSASGTRRYCRGNFSSPLEHPCSHMEWTFLETHRQRQLNSIRRYHVESRRLLSVADTMADGAG